MICIVDAKCDSYPDAGNLFRPDKKYPEYPYQELSSSANHVYDAVRNALHLMHFDEENYGTKQWNPLGGFIQPGMRVLIKPNLVMDFNENRKGGVECLYTQPGVVAPIIDYVAIALKGKGSIIIGDAPMQECNFDKLIIQSGYKNMVRYYRSKGIRICIADFRGLKSKIKGDIRIPEINDDSNGKVINLGIESEFAHVSKARLSRLRITNYDPDILARHHNEKKHEYYISSDVLKADVIINMPKPKTHRKAGVTIAMKNMVGINRRKEFLPHHTLGSVQEGGDCYLNQSYAKKTANRLLDKKNYFAQTNRNYRMAFVYGFAAKVIYRLGRPFYKDRYSEGSWYGNDTISRTICDLNKIIFYADKNGIMKDQVQRKYLIVADMIVTGEKEGPVSPSPKKSGIIAVGMNPVYFDECIAFLMGAQIEKLPFLKRAGNIKGKYRLSEKGHGVIISNCPEWNGETVSSLENKKRLYHEPANGWKAVFDDFK